ncbi:MAG: DUF4494 domain-containing protein [Bacteroidota bacterium]
MQTWFNCKVKYLKVDEHGKEKKVTEPYLIDAVTFSDAETRIHKILEPYVRGGLEIDTLSKANIEEVFDFEDDGVWYKAKVTYLDVDPDTEKKKKITQYVLVRAGDVKQAYERTEENLSLLVPYDIPSVQETPILDVFPYESDPEKELEGKNVRPLEEDEQVNRMTGEIETPKENESEETQEPDMDEENPLPGEE